MSIEVTALSKSYGTQKALDNISFSVKRGEIVGFLGPNGAGKSTLMKILTTYINADSGSASVNGFDVSTNESLVQKSVGYLPEHNPLYLDLYVREYLEFNADVYKADKSRIDEVITLTGLTPESHKKIGQLSKGYRQRVGLASALLHNPDVLILDKETHKQNYSFNQLVKAWDKTGLGQIMVERIDFKNVESYGIVELGERDCQPFKSTPLLGLIEKPHRKDAPSNLAVLGRYILPSEVLSLLEITKPGLGGEIQLTDALGLLLNNNELNASLLITLLKID